MRFTRDIKDRRDPRQQKLASRISWLAFWLVMGLLGAAISVGIGVTRVQLYFRGQPELQKISCAALCNQGPGKNVHIELTDYDYGSKHYIQMQKDSGGKLTGSWNTVFLSVFPKGRADDPTSPIVIVRSSKIENGDDLARFKTRQALQGLVVDGFEDCTREEKY